jgi:hypothetical protein
MAASLPAFIYFAERVDSAAAARGVSVVTFAVAVVGQFGFLDDDGGSRRRRR